MVYLGGDHRVERRDTPNTGFRENISMIRGDA